MKSLRDFIIEKCENIYYESLLDNENELINNDDILVKEFLDKYICDSKTFKSITDKVTIRKTAKGIVVDYTSGNGIDYKYKVGDELTSLTNGLFKFGRIEGDFYCTNAKNIINLEGAPDYVSGLFSCAFSKVKTLKGAPRYANEFNCESCKYLKTLKGAPDEVDIFICARCRTLKSLEGAPKKVNNDFDCSQCIKLIDLKGAPKEVGGNFKCKDCDNLKSLEGAPQYVKFSFNCSQCIKLIDLKGAPKEVGGNFYANNCKELTSVEYANGEELYISGCESLPEDVKKPAGIRKEVLWLGWRGRD